MFPLNNKVYDVLKWLAQVVFPGLAALYFGLSSIWGLPYTGEVVGTIMGLSVFLGAIIGLSTFGYYKQESLANERAYANNIYKELTHQTRPFVVSPKVYEVVKWIVLIVFPACGALYFTLSELWQLPYGEQVSGTIAILTTFLGIMMGVSTSQFEKVTGADTWANL